MALPLARVNTDKQTLAVENFGPRLQRVKIVERDLYALFYSPFVFLPRRKVRREKDAAFIKFWQDVYQMLVDLRDRDGMTIILVDQQIRQALKIADYVYVLELGHNKFEGPVEEFSDLKKAFWA